VIERRVKSFGDLLADLGGFIDILLIIGAFMVGSCVEKLFNADIISNIYTVDSESLSDRTKIGVG
jgi:hypothetical protein